MKKKKTPFFSALPMGTCFIISKKSKINFLITTLFRLSNSIGEPHGQLLQKHVEMFKLFYQKAVWFKMYVGHPRSFAKGTN